MSAPILSYSQGTCEDFEGLEDGTVYIPGDEAPLNSLVDLSISYHTDTEGNTSSGQITVNNVTEEGLDGLNLHTQNALVNFKMKAPVSELSIGLKETGGEVEVIIDGQRYTFPSVAFMDGGTVGNSNVKLVYGTTGQPVGVIVSGRFSECAIGGADVRLDNLCVTGTATSMVTE